MFQGTSDGTYFRVLAVVAFGLFMISSSSSSAVGVPKGCLAVAVYAKQMAIESITIDLRLVSNIIDCIKELHSLSRTTDWKEINSMIPKAVRDVLRNVPNLGKKALAVATRVQALCFMPLYSLYKAVDMFHEAMTLNMEYKMYRGEFERLQMELELAIDQIHNELLPNWEHSSTTALQKTSTEVLQKLDRFYAELKQLARFITSGINKSHSNRDWAVTSLFGSVFLFVTSLATGNIPVAAVSGAAGLTSLASNAALTRAIHRLESLQRDVEITCNEIKEYRSLLLHEMSQTRSAPVSNLSVVFHFLVTAISLCLVYLVVAREAVDGPTGQTGTGRTGRIGTGRVGTKQRYRRAPRVRSAPAGIARFRTARVLKKVKYTHGHKNAVNRETVLLNRSRKKTRTTSSSIILRQDNT